MMRRHVMEIVLLMVALLPTSWAVRAQAETPPFSAAAPGTAPERSASYHWVATWGDTVPQGQLYRPRAIAAGANGNVFVADTGAHRIQVFTADGAFVRAFGHLGSGNGEFYTPTGIAVSGDHVYVADTLNSRVQVFTRSGAFIRSVGRPGGFENDSLGMPMGVGISPAGQIYVMDLLFDRIARFSSTGLFQTSYPVEYPAAGSLAVGSAGEAYYPSSLGGVIRIAPDGTRRTIGGVQGQPDYIAAGRNVACAPDGSLWVYDSQTAHIFHFSATGNFLGHFPVPGPVNGLTVTASRVFVMTSAPQVAVYDWTGTHQTTWGSTVTLMFDQPDALAAAPDGTFYVLEKSQRRIRHMDNAGHVLKTIAPEAGQGYLALPTDIAVDGWGRLYVLDQAYNDRVVRFVAGRFDTSFPVSAVHDDYYPPNRVSSIVITGDFLFSVANGVTIQSSVDGAYLNDWQDQRSRAVLNEVDITSTGQMYRLTRYDTPFVRGTTFRGLNTYAWGSAAQTALEPGAFVYPQALAADQRGRVFVLDTDNRSQAPSSDPLYSSRVQAFTENGQYLFSFGSFGSGDGQLAGAQGLVVLRNGFIVVADTRNNRLQLFAPDDPLPPVTPLPSPTTWSTPLPPAAITWQDQGPRGSSTPTQITLPPQGSPQRPVLVTYRRAQLARSTDGVHWSRQPFNVPVKGSPDWSWPLLYAGASTLVADGGYTDTAYRSTDMGQTWTRMGDALASGPKDMAASPTFDDDNTLFAAVYRGGFWRSTDRGDTWELRSLANRPIDRIQIAANAQGQRVMLVLQYDAEILHSTDDGGSWQPTGLGRDRLWPKLSPTFAQDQTAFALGSSGPELSRSIDGGVTWQTVPAHGLSGQSQWRGLVMSPAYAADHSLVAWTTDRAYLSTDGGSNWTPFGPVVPNQILRFIAFAPDYAVSQRVWLSRSGRGDGFIMTTDGGATWQLTPNGLPGTFVRGLMGEASTPWAETPDGVLVQNNENNWAWLPGIGPPANGGQRAFAQSSTFEVDRTAVVDAKLTTDGGQTWRTLEIGSTGTQMAAAFAPDFIHSQVMLMAWNGSYRAMAGSEDGEAAVAQNEPTAVLTTNAVAVSEDGGVTWRAQNLPALSPYPRVALIVDRGTQAHRFFMGGDGGLIYSDDQGRNWTLTGPPVRIQQVVGLVPMQEDGRTVLYAATKPRGVWRSEDLGLTWTEFNQRLPNGHACALDGDQDVLILGLCNGGVYVWRVDPPGWKPLGTALPGGITSVLVRRERSSGVVWAGTGGGVYQTRLPGLPAFKAVWFPLIP